MSSMASSELEHHLISFEDKDDGRKDVSIPVFGQTVTGTDPVVRRIEETKSSERRLFGDKQESIRAFKRSFIKRRDAGAWKAGPSATVGNSHDKEVRAEFEGQSANGKVDGCKYEARALICTVDRPDELGSEKHTPLEKLDKKHFANKAAEHQNDDSKLMEIQREKNLYETTLLEQTKENDVAKKQAPSLYEEIDSEREDEQVPDIESDDEDQQIDNNSFKLPKGGDKKPIPYWLYKLHAMRQAGNNVVYHH